MTERIYQSPDWSGGGVRFDVGKIIVLERLVAPPESPSLVERQAEQTALLKKEIDIFAAQNRAKACGCPNCHKDLQRVKEWYQ